MAELTETELERLERYEAGTLSAEERAAFEAELAARPELAEALEGAKQVAAALPSLAAPTLPAQARRELADRALPGRRKARLWPVLVAAGLAAFGWWRFGFDEISSAGGVVTVDARTLVAGEAITSGDDVVTGEVGVAVVRRRSSQWLVAPKSEVHLRGNTLERGVVVVQGRAPLSVKGAWVEVNGEALISLEPVEGSFRETAHLEPGDLMDGKRLRVVVGGAAVGVVTIYVLSGTTMVTPPDELMPQQLNAGATWTAAPKPSPKSVRRGSDFEQWPTDVPRPVGASERLDAGTSARGDQADGARAPGATERVPDQKGLGAERPPRTIHPVTTDGIRAAMEEVLPEIADCYEGWVQQQPQLAGRLVIGFSIGPDDAGVGGAVHGLGIADGGLGHALLEGCLLNVMDGLRFERPDDEVEVNYPITFSNEAAGDAGP